MTVNIKTPPQSAHHHDHASCSPHDTFFPPPPSLHVRPSLRPHSNHATTTKPKLKSHGLRKTVHAKRSCHHGAHCRASRSCFPLLFPSVCLPHGHRRPVRQPHFPRPCHPGASPPVRGLQRAAEACPCPCYRSVHPSRYCTSKRRPPRGANRPSPPPWPSCPRPVLRFPRSARLYRHGQCIALAWDKNKCAAEDFSLEATGGVFTWSNSSGKVWVKYVGRQHLQQQQQ